MQDKCPTSSAIAPVTVASISKGDIMGERNSML